MKQFNSEVFVSFIIASYNCAKLVGQLGEEARRWKGRKVEFIVADGGSSDGTIEEFARYPEISVVVSKPDLGIYDAWNRAIAFAQGKYLAFIGVDDRPSLRFFEKLSTRCDDKNFNPSLVYGDAVLCRANRVRKILSPTTSKFLLGQAINFDFPHPGAYNNRELFASILFDPSYRLAGDFDFYLRAREIAGFSAIKLDEVQAFIGADGASRAPGATAVYKEERSTALKRVGCELQPLTFQERVLERVERNQFVFGLLKELSWLIRGKRDRA